MREQQDDLGLKLAQLWLLELTCSEPFAKLFQIFDFCWDLEFIKDVRLALCELLKAKPLIQRDSLLEVANLSSEGLPSLIVDGLFDYWWLEYNWL